MIRQAFNLDEVSIAAPCPVGRHLADAAKRRVSFLCLGSLLCSYISSGCLKVLIGSCIDRLIRDGQWMFLMIMPLG